jgi:hypothetical protein
MRSLKRCYYFPLWYSTIDVADWVYAVDLLLSYFHSLAHPLPNSDNVRLGGTSFYHNLTNT